MKLQVRIHELRRPQYYHLDRQRVRSWTVLVAGDFYTRDRFGHEDDLGRAAERAIDTTLLGLISQADIAIVNLEGPVRTSSAPI